MKRNTVEFGTSVYITSLFCSGKKMGKLSERNRIVEIRKTQAGEPVAFMGVEDGRLEMLFLSPEERGHGLGKSLLQMGIEQYGVTEVTVNEQNPQAVGFYEHLGFVTYKRTDHDEEGNPYPLLYMKM